MDQKYLQFIGKGQITIPQVWRSLLHLDSKIIKATLNGNKIVLESLDEAQDKDWEVSHIALNTLSHSDQKLILQGRQAYQKKKKEKFMTSSEFFKQD
jgi:bifunctional DNA-binding transcriptional regulator/antitoxin component of YhaV-PrlF toxin-antitoxin module